MSNIVEVKVPDIGDFTDVPVIDVFVKVGDTIKVDDAIVTLESDKATMDVPSSVAGVVKEVKVKLGDRISEGSVVVLVETGAAAGAAAPAAPAPAPAAAPVAAPAPAAATGGSIEVKVPDIGDFDSVPVIDVFVKVGDTVKVDDALVTLESDKATMDVPSSAAGIVKEVKVKLGDKVSEGSVIIIVETAGGGAVAAAAPQAAAPAPAAAPANTPASAPAPAKAAAAPAAAVAPTLPLGSKAHASPSVRAYARELGVDLGRVTATGPKGRILKEDVTGFIKGVMSAPAAAAGGGASLGGGLDLLPWPKVDFAKFGPIERKEQSRIKKISAANLHRNWVVIPHVTTHDEADITELEQFRVQMNKELEKSGVKVSMLPFMMKAAVATLKKFPEFNASLDGDALVLKNYWHIGFAADTPNGLMVPVIRDVDKKTIPEITKEMGELAKLARDGKLKPDQMSGGTFTISSLGGIGGIYFTPIINAPEVAIMGVCKSYWKQHSSDGKTSAWRLTLPLSLSWDHRVIDGAAAARFNVHFANLLADMRRIMF